MIFRRAFVPAAAFFCGLASAQDGTLNDIQLGMQGLMEASKNPEVLAQLLKDMQVRSEENSRRVCGEMSGTWRR